MVEMQLPLISKNPVLLESPSCGERQISDLVGALHSHPDQFAVMAEYISAVFIHTMERCVKVTVL